jgi:hypothetical protein
MKYDGACSATNTKQDYAQRREQRGCACPEGKSLPLHKAYPEAKRESNRKEVAQFKASNREMLSDFILTIAVALAGPYEARHRRFMQM